MPATPKGRASNADRFLNNKQYALKLIIDSTENLGDAALFIILELYHVIP